MSSEPNFNEIAATVIQGQINNAIGAVSKHVRAAITRIFEIINKDLTRYTAAKIKRCSYIRTPIINRDRSTYIYDIYVPTRLRVRGKIVPDDDFIAQLAASDSVVIAGNAGSGKSMLMRHLFLTLCDKSHAKIPLFFELRDINASDKKNLQEFLYYNLVGSNATITEAQFSDSLKAGVFCLVLDGFDEINFGERKDIEAQIRRLREQCPDLQIIVSSRPDADRRIESWQDFRAVYVEPMDEAQATELINKLEYDTKVKEKFLREAKATLFRSHNTFLSNPLLCIMMLVTFEQTGHIPTKRHVFYERAFDALFALHDASKEGVYKRRTYSALSIDDFRNCMSAFCMITYLREQFVFSRLQFREALQSTLKLEKVSVDIDSLTNDMIESTCLIQIEGTDYVFTHRSFQEYFAAVFISRSPAVGAKSLLDRACVRYTDDVVAMTYAINRGLVEREWIIPTLSAVLASDSAATITSSPFNFIFEHVGGLGFSVGDRGLPDAIHFYHNEQGVKLYTIGQVCRHITNRSLPLLDFKASPADLAEINSLYVQMAQKRDPRLTASRNRNLKVHGTVKPSQVQRMVTLGADETEWILRTTVPSYLVGIVDTFRELLATCDAEARSEEDILTEINLRPR